jgi:hypothetical protein
MAGHCIAAAPAGRFTFFRTMINSAEMLSFAGSVFRAVTLGLFAVFLLASLPQTVLHVAGRIGYAASWLTEPPLAARRRVQGERYVDAIENIRRVVPIGGEYLLVNGGQEWQGNPYWLRFELAPRRARFLGLLSELPDGETLRRRLAPGRSPVVIAFPEGVPPVVMDRESFLRQLDRLHGRG